MEPVLPYLIKVVLISAIMYCYYHIFLRNRRFHRYNRFYLLLSVALSIFLPLISFGFSGSSDPGSRNSVLHTDFVVEAVSPRQSLEFISDFQFLLIGFYLVVVAIFLVLLIASLRRIHLIRKAGEVEHYRDFTLIITDAGGTPFSFFGIIFWNPKISFETSDGEKMLKHELVHVKQLHSLDKLALSLVQLFFWFNPVFWIIKRELNMIHEFLADKEAFRESDVRQFSKIVLHTAYPVSAWPANNPFFYSPVKRRMIMILKNNLKSKSYFSRLMVLPVATLMVAFFSMKVSAKQQLTNGIDTDVMRVSNSVAYDTIPGNPQLRSLEIFTPANEKPYMQVIWNDGRKEKLTLEEAKKRGIAIPPPPPPPPGAPPKHPSPPNAGMNHNSISDFDEIAKNLQNGKSELARARTALEKQSASFEKVRAFAEEQRVTLITARADLEEQKAAFELQRSTAEKERSKFEKQKNILEEERTNLKKARDEFERTKSAFE